MAIIKKREFKEMNEETLRTRLAELRLDLAKSKSQIIVGGAAANAGRIKEQKKTVARILTELNKMKKGGV
jgi:large subunit ribosomal protein L29